MKYDDASWHYGGNYPKNLPKKNASTHIGMFLTWIIENNFVGEFHINESSKEIELLKKRKISGSDFLINQCDEKFTDEDLNEYITPFVNQYYEDEYFEDYYLSLGNTIGENDDIYLIKDSWKNYETLKSTIDKKFNIWKQKNN